MIRDEQIKPFPTKAWYKHDDISDRCKIPEMKQG